MVAVSSASYEDIGVSELSRRIANLSPEQRVLLEQRLVKNMAGTAAEHRATVRPRNRAQPAPLSFAQQRLWFLAQLDADSRQFTVAAGLRLHGRLDIPALRRALDTIVARHEVLRTTFQTVDGSPVQVIAESGSIDLPLIDLSGQAESRRDAEVARLVEQTRQHRFDLSRDLPLHPALVRLSRDEHILLMAWHHVASDNWSAGVFDKELSALYGAFVRGEPSPLPELPIQYADFALWQRERLQGPPLEALLSYWRAQMTGSPTSLDLPTDRPRPRVQTSQGAEEVVQLPRMLSEGLQQLSRQEEATLFMTLVAAFKTLLYRYSGQTDLLVGTPVSGRQAVEAEGLIGLFLNTLVLRTDLGGDPTFRELLHRVRTVALGAYSHQELPFERLVEDLRVERDLSRTPLFQVMFNLRNRARPPLELAGLSVTRLEIESTVAQGDLNLAVVERPDGLRLQLEYSTDLFDRETIVRMLGHYETLLHAVVADPDRPISTLPLMAEAERRQLLHTWNDTALPFPQDRSLVRLFEDQVSRTPNATAFVCNGERLSYAELNRRANQLAHYLRGQGVGQEQVVGLCLERSLDAAVGLLGILKAGAAYLPLDPAYPTARLRFMIEDSDARLVVTRQRFMETLSLAASRQALCLDTDQAQVERQPVENVAVDVAPDRLAYVIYTSGSTGQPKGVAVEHRQILNRLWWMWHAYPFAPDEASCQKTALSFVDSLWELLGPLLQGIPTVILPDDTVRDPQRLVQSLGEHRVTRLWLVPSLLRVLLENVPHLQQRLPALKMWVSSGEMLPVELLQRFQGLMPDSTLFNLYGTSETWDVTWFAPLSGATGTSRVPIGRPIANMQTYILDQHLEPVPLGVAGELYLGGVGLGRGYVNRPELTRERFVRHPFLNSAGARLYRSGDLARYLPDGNIEFLGRRDEQIKLRGFRIELGEIEAALAQHPEVRQGVVVAHEDGKAGARLVAYMVGKQPGRPSASDLRLFLRGRLPEYMMPTGFVALDSLPLTPSGKVDRRALPALDPVETGDESTFVAPRDDLELQLALMWEQLLGRKHIGVRDSFFDLGGHSLLAVRLFAQIHERLGQRLPLATLFEAPTIEGLSRLLRAEGWAPHWSTLVAIQPGGTKPPLFCIPPAGVTALSFAELGRQLGPDQPVYALQPLGLDGDQPPQTSVEEMAALYLKEIRALQPEGPYLLGGRCFGGIVAYEMALRLKAEGQEVALLAVLDGWPPIPVHRSADHYVKRAVQHWRQGRLLVAIKRSVRDRQRRIERRIRSELSRLGNGEAYRLQLVLDAHMRANRCYAAQTYPGRISLFWSGEWDAFAAELFQPGWERLAADGVESFLVGGSHDAMLRGRSVQALASQLRTRLEVDS